MALQNTDIQRLEWLKEQVDRLAIRFPVAEIAEKTGFDQGNISSYLKGKKRISDNFLTKFQAAYKVVYGVDSPDEPSTKEILKVLADAFKEQAKAFSDQAALMRSIESKMAREDTQAKIDKAVERVEASLKNGVNNQNWVAGLAVEILTLEVQSATGGNKEKEKEMLATIAQRIGPSFPAFLKTGKFPG